jgi:hypothetical protein
MKSDKDIPDLFAYLPTRRDLTGSEKADADNTKRELDDLVHDPECNCPVLCV